MRICVVGGVFGQSRVYRAALAVTPEILLVEGLGARGHEVVGVGHGVDVTGGRFDVVHVHHVGRGAYALASSPLRARFVFTGHDGMMLEGYQRNPFRRAAFWRTVSRADGVVALSEREGRFLQRGAPGRVAVIPNGVAATHHGALGEGPRAGILYVGQLVPLKGLDVLLDALAARSDVTANLTFVYHHGPLEQDLRARAARLGLAGRVRFMGSRSPSELAALYRAAEVLVLPSRAESLPSVVTEAVLAGTPVVASDVGAISEQVAGFGRVVPRGDSSALGAALAEVLACPPTPEERSAARERTRARYAVDRMLEAHEMLYEQVCAAPPVARGGGLVDLAARAAIRRYWGAPAPLPPEGV